MHFTLADLLADITQNGFESGADFIELELGEIWNSPGKGEFRFSVKDNGRGMTARELKLAQDPFAGDGLKHRKRKVGLGIPFLIQTAEQSGGGWNMESRKQGEPGAAGADRGTGTKVSAWFDLGNVDTPPAGDIPGMIRTVLLFHGPAEVVIRRVRQAPDGRIVYELRKTELAGALGCLSDARSLILLDKYLRSLELR